MTQVIGVSMILCLFSAIFGAMWHDRGILVAAGVFGITIGVVLWIVIAVRMIMK